MYGVTGSGPHSASDGEQEFIGRRSQLDTLRACAGQVREGTPWVVVVEGEAGIGKSLLVRQALAELDDFTVWWATCDLTEQDYALGVVDQLIRKVPRSILAEAPSLSRPPTAEPRSPIQVGADVVRLLGAAQETQPVAAVVDDIQWADEASMAALGFAARRLWAERVLVVVITRTERRPGEHTAATLSVDWQRIVAGVEHGHQIVLSGFADQEIIQLARSMGRANITLEAADRLRKYTGGNPLYLRSVLNETPSDDLADPLRTLPAPKSLAHTVHRALNRLPPNSRDLLEALAILNSRVPLAIAARLAQVDDPASALEPVLNSGMAEWRPGDPSSPVEIRHTLQQEAIYRAIPPLRRRALHAAAVPLVDSAAAWAHRVAATDRVAPELATELQTEADRVAAQGQLSRAATLLLWAADLSDRREDQERRLLTAAVRLLLGKNYRRCAALRHPIETCTPSALRTCVLGRLAYSEGGLEMAAALLSEALHVAESEGSPQVIALACVWLGATYSQQMRGEEALPLFLRALSLDLPAPRAVSYARYLLSLASADMGEPRAGLRALADTTALPEQAAQVALADSLLLSPRGILRGMAGELHAGMEDLMTLVRRQRAGEVTEVQVSEYFILAAFQYLAGVWEDAEVTAQNALTLAAANGQLFGFAPAHAVAAMVAAGQGRWDAAVEHQRASEKAARESEAALDGAYPILAAAVLAQAKGDPTAMAQAMQRFAPPGAAARLAGWHVWWLPLQVEAYIGTGRLDMATTALGQLQEMAEDAPCLRVTEHWLTGELAEARQDTQNAIAAYRNGLALPVSDDDVPLHRARLEHAYSRILRTTGEHEAAREHLLRARRAYQEIGATPFAERAASELGALGAEGRPDDTKGQSAVPGTSTAAPATAGPPIGLTERERAVAHLAAQGLTNQEIAGELFVSTKTVEYHLGHVYAKLGLTSRRQLRKALK
ncbi:AAA family ATPase [Kitasatospora sp. NPDC048540]|uniref:helix-turn-helix transcriptional regulator n=1 Tax=unclassified Kitasatospora TaxID=2633591 RepID=UPI00068BDF9A|nr:LuxR family transcriptional regulator [Kitasatospora sp. MBT63]